MSSYPRSLIPILKRKWQSLDKRINGEPPVLPSNAELETLLDVAYHASFLTEEGRRPGFRVVYSSPESLAQDDKHGKGRSVHEGSRLLPLDESRPYTVAEINRLAPAAELTRFVMCVTNTAQAKESPSLRIWSLLDVGSSWWRFLHGQSDSGRLPPNHLTITSSNPGGLSISVQGEVLVTLKSGEIHYPADNALEGGPVADFLGDAKRQLRKDALMVLNADVWDADGIGEDYPLDFYIMFLERILFHIRQKEHGGTVIIIPSYISKDDTRLADRINIKYSCEYNYVWYLMVETLVNHRRYYDLHFPLWNGKEELTAKLFQQHSILRSEGNELDEVLGDTAQAIASLTSVDGAVVMTDRLHVLGFGAEVIAASPSLTEIVIATRSKYARAPIQSYGTRHRAAFRFCSSLEDSVAFVVSSDGGVKVVKRVGKDVLLWPDINTGAMGL